MFYLQVKAHPKNFEKNQPNLQSVALLHDGAK